MTPPAAKLTRIDRVDADLVDVRERLTRVETSLEAHDKASERRHEQLVEVIEELGGRIETIEGRAWKLAMGLALVGASGGAGGLQLVQSLLGG